LQTLEVSKYYGVNISIFLEKCKGHNPPIVLYNFNEYHQTSERIKNYKLIIIKINPIEFFQAKKGAFIFKNSNLLNDIKLWRQGFQPG
jgi:hypothetical protein